ncbi:Schwann cell myelin protein [Gadus morhua]|uniref:Schwann cell myelin protein n=1 Tax=Gadus morhua TaxID=8049 RepID=UPI0011B605F0|nr:Schwann cell myelin protein-like [Gadus morhua]XP_030225229.1 Schwann cell myelin protein-like [Gadus morhua]
MADVLQHVLLTMVIAGFLVCGSGAWYVKMPSHIKALWKSCLVIPCSFDYHQSPPKVPGRVVWYQYARSGYPLVYDAWYNRKVISKFSGKTSLVRHGPRDCSLQISRVDSSLHMEKIYTWVDPENVGWKTYKFYDTTVTIQVEQTAEPPKISIYGEMKVGQSVTVQCSVVHTCPTFPPTLKLNIGSEGSKVATELLLDGTARTTLTVSLHIQSDQQRVGCSVRHHGGLEAAASGSVEAECSFQPLRIVPPSDRMFPEGKVSSVSCSVEYSCPKHVPTLTWNYRSMPSTLTVSMVGVGRWRAQSELNFTAAAQYQGRPLTCVARFTGGRRQEESMTIEVKRSILSRGWSYETPGSINGLVGSCAVIPCSFTYTSTRPSGLEVKWYLLQPDADPQVFPQKQGMAVKYAGRTSLPGSVSQGNCSLYIERLEMSLDQNRLYPWVDKNPITSYQDHNLYDRTSQLRVTEIAQQPQVKMNGVPWVGEEMKVFCSVRHSCPAAPPNLTLDAEPLGRTGGRLSETEVSHGVWERTLELTWTVREEDVGVVCTVRHPGGQTAKTNHRMKAECPLHEIKMSEEPGELMEGVARHVTCSVSYICKKPNLAITWNYSDMQSSRTTLETSGNTFNTTSILTFVPSLEDDGKVLTCTAQFTPGGTFSASSSLRVKKYKQRFVTLDNIDNKSTILAADVLPKITALPRSCVVIPCSFQMPDHLKTGLRGIWYNREGGRVYHGGQSKVLTHFKGRTKLLGTVGHGNCTLEINDIKPFDNGPFCFRAEAVSGEAKYSFNDSCVFIVMQASPERPRLTAAPTDVDAGSVINATCSVNHTCPSQPPVLTWSHPTNTAVIGHTWMGQGVWETSSTVTLIPEWGDGTKHLSCTATFSKRRVQVAIVQFTVKGSLMFQLRSSMHVTIPASVVVIVVLLAAVIAVCLRRKCKRQTENFSSPPPRPEKRSPVGGRVKWTR